MELDTSLFHRIKELCLDFFATGILLGEPQKKGIKIFNVDKMHEATEQFDGELMTPFEYWWDLYDKKRGKEKCIKKWNQMTNDECIACISATSAYVASTPDKQFRKDPLTYLNQKAWNDEIIPRNNGTDKPSLDEQRKDKLASILTE
jgi:hypothetical protein